MAKKYKIVLSVLLVVLIAIAAVLISGVIDINKMVHPEEPTSGNSAESDDYTQTFTTDISAALPLMSTDIDNIYFTMTKQGDVKFYKVENAVISEIPATGSFDVTAACSGQKIPAKIHYLEIDGKTIGYGLYTSLLYEGIYLYDYAFFKVTEMFDAFKDSNGTLLMMLDVESDRFYSEDKVYSEIFYLYSDHTTKHFLSEDQRTVDINARDKTDYKMFTDDILNQGNNKNVLFFSSRYYLMYEESEYVDIFTSGGSGTNVDNIRYLTDVAALVFWRTDKGVYFFANHSDDTGFSLCLYADSERKVIKSFAGDYDEDYIRSGKYLLNKKTGEIYNCLDGTTKQLVYSCFKEGFKPDKFVMNESGTACVIRGANTENVAASAVMNFKTGEITAYTDEVFSYYANSQVLDDGTVIISLANGESASAYYQLVTKIN